MDDPHEYFMQMAIDQALAAGRMEEVPVGAVIVDADGQVIARDHNRTVSSCDPSAHAEINVLRAAARQRQNYRLLSTILYVTLNLAPCVWAPLSTPGWRPLYSGHLIPNGVPPEAFTTSGRTFG
jgi:tRNA(adenine34) deaminase